MENQYKEHKQRDDGTEIPCGVVILTKRRKGEEPDGEIKILENGTDNFLKGTRNKPKSTHGNYIEGKGS